MSLLILLPPTGMASGVRIKKKSNLNIYPEPSCSLQSRWRTSNMVDICGEDVHSSQHLPTHSCVWHDAPGPRLRHRTAHHVRPEEHLCPGHVRNQHRKVILVCFYFYIKGLYLWWRIGVIVDRKKRNSKFLPKNVLEKQESSVSTKSQTILNFKTQKFPSFLENSSEIDLNIF